MTNEEAIDILRNTAWLGTDTDRKQIEEAMEMAINALQAQEQLAKNSPKLDSEFGDLISRRAAIDAIGTWDKFGVDERSRMVGWHEGLEPYVHLRDVVVAICNLPSAQPEIIHCRDCKHKGTKNCVANAWTTIFGVMVKDDFYCGLAERKTDGLDKQTGGD